jgi:hypothetical protein
MFPIVCEFGGISDATQFAGAIDQISAAHVLDETAVPRHGLDFFELQAAEFHQVLEPVCREGRGRERTFR